MSLITTVRQLPRAINERLTAYAASQKAFDQGLGTIAAGAHIFQPGSIGGQTGIFSNLPRSSNTGLTVSTDSALSYSPFWQAVNIYGNDIGQVSLDIYERVPQGDGKYSRRKAYDHPLYSAVHGKANPRLTSFQWRKTMMAHQLCWGNHYSAIARNGRGQVEFWPLSPERMQIWLNEPQGDPIYTYSTAFGELKGLARADVFHVPWLAWDGLMGMAPIRYGREVVGLGLATEQHGATFFRNGATASLVLTTDGELTDNAWQHLKDTVNGKTGLSTAWDPWILEEGLKPFTLSVPNDTAQWLETRKHQVAETARLTNLPAYKLASLEPGAVGYSSVQQYATDYVVGSLTPVAVNIETAIGMQLLGDDWTENGGRFYAKLNLDSLMRGDMTARYVSYTEAIVRGGWMTRADARDLEDMDAIDGLELPLVPLNMSTIDNADMQKYIQSLDRGITTANQFIALFPDAGEKFDGGDEHRVLLRTGDVPLLEDLAPIADAPAGTVPPPAPAVPPAAPAPKKPKPPATGAPTP